jgi:hypothetical protein
MTHPNRISRVGRRRALLAAVRASHRHAVLALRSAPWPLRGVGASRAGLLALWLAAALSIVGCAAPTSQTSGTSGAARPPAALGPQVPDAPASAPLRVVSNDETWLVVYRLRPPSIPLNEPFAVEVTIFDQRRNQAQVSDLTLHVDAAMPEHRHGMNVVAEVWKNNDGSYTATGLVFHMPGRWELYFDITEGLVTERAQVEVWLD